MRKEKERKGKLAQRSFTDITMKESGEASANPEIKILEGIPIVYDTPTIITEPDGFQYEEIIQAGAVHPKESGEASANPEIKILEGIPIVYDTPTIITEPDGFQYEEIIQAGAVHPEAITRDTALYYNHDLTSKPLARVRNGKLIFTHTENGVAMKAEINTERSDARDLYIAIRDGDINQMSFMFRVEDDEWDITEQGIPKRTIKKIGYVHEVSAVADPAYETTTITARSGERVETITDAVETARSVLKKYKDEEKKQGILALEKAKARALIDLWN